MKLKVFNDELHCGSDFIRRYVADGHVFTGATAVMKVRAENDIELVAADCTVDGDSVTVKIPGERSREIPRRYRMAKYDVFSWASIDCDGSTWDYGTDVGYVKQDKL